MIRVSNTTIAKSDETEKRLVPAAGMRRKNGNGTSFLCPSNVTPYCMPQ
ncbi:MAG: hypothetical protein J6Z82_01385 [Schwartzia sp.]|nr:hypothetical protein [Schwartzia sp. (in: firmicutes)]